MLSRQAKRLKMVQTSGVISGRPLAAARVLLGLTQKEVAQMARISVSTLKRYEADGIYPPLHNNWIAVIHALEAAGVEFIAENGGGAGVRLRKSSIEEGADFVRR